MITSFSCVALLEFGVGRVGDNFRSKSIPRCCATYRVVRTNES